jgi:radical SAM protein with 4Fe4S-binding SPASM domain
VLLSPHVRIGTLTLELTHRCHRRCAFCYIPDLARPEDPTSELPTQDVVRAARSLIEGTGCKNVQLSGGEPLLREDLLPILDGLRDVGARVSIITDAAHLDEPLARALAARRVRSIQPTLLSGSDEVHDALRGRGAFRSVTRAIAVASAAGLEVSVCMVITRRNHQEASRVAELAFGLGARGLALSRFTPAGAAVRAFDVLMPSSDEVRSACEAAVATCRALGLPVASAVTIPARVFADAPVLRTGVCSLVGPRGTVTMGPDGSVRSCCLSGGSAGNVLEDPWDEIGRRLEAVHFEPMRAVPTVCASCPQLARCLGGCRLSALAVFGDGDHPDPLCPQCGSGS